MIINLPHPTISGAVNKKGCITVKKINKALIALILSTLLFVAALTAMFILPTDEGFVLSAPYSTEKQNFSLAIDEESDKFVVGSYNNELHVFDLEGNSIWDATANGPYRDLIIREDEGLLYAANEDNNVYIHDLNNGELINTINVQRRIYDIDITEDGSELLVSAGINTNKHNILIYSTDGEQLQNLQYQIRIQSVAYSADDSAIILANNRAEVKKIDREGNELAELRGQYELVSMHEIEQTQQYIALGIDGSYMVFDDSLTLLRNGKVNEAFEITATTVGSSLDGGYIFVGSEEHFYYIFNSDDQQVYSSRIENSITDVIATENNLYFTGFGDFVMNIDLSMLEMVFFADTVRPYIFYSIFIFGSAALLLLLLYIKVTRALLTKIAKTFWRFKLPYILLLPTFILLIMFNYTPVFIAFTRAFTDWSKDNATWATMSFIGFDNFRLMISEGYFLTGVGNLFILIFTSFAKVLTVPLLVAWLVYSMKNAKQKYIYRFLFVLPMIVPGVVTTLMWQQIYDPNIGLINQLLEMVNLEHLQRVWLGDEKTALASIIFMGFPFVNVLAFLVYYGGFLEIDASLLEAATIDGANRNKTFWRVQLPQIVSQIQIILVLTFIGVVQDFTSIYLLTGGGPGTSTYVPGLELYYNATVFGRYGYASALGVVMFIFIMIGTIINLRIKAKRD